MRSTYEFKVGPELSESQKLQKTIDKLRPKVTSGYLRTVTLFCDGSKVRPEIANRVSTEGFSTSECRFSGHVEIIASIIVPMHGHPSISKVCVYHDKLSPRPCLTSSRRFLSAGLNALCCEARSDSEPSAPRAV